MRPPLSPSRLLATGAVFPAGAQPTWFRLIRTDDGLLCLESISDAKLSRAQSLQSEDPWAFVADVPPHIAQQLTNDDDPDNVVKVLNRALHALGIGEP